MSLRSVCPVTLCGPLLSLSPTAVLAQGGWPGFCDADPLKKVGAPDPRRWDLGKHLRTVFQGKSVQGKPVLVQNIVAAQDAARCHVLYVPETERKRFREISVTLSAASVLTVSEHQLGEPGIVIGLPLVDDHIQIQVDLRLAQQSGLAVSSKLLRLAAVAR